MGVCCSKTAKETGTSSSRHYVSVNSSPSLLPTENGYEQDSTLERGIEETRSRLEKAAETASVVDFNEKSSRSAFIETSVETTWEAKHRLGEGKESWESLVYNPRWNAEWSEGSSTDNEDRDNKVIPLKPRCSGAMRRLKKKDSTRQPKYKDEIMLTDNIDSIVEKEIPEVPDDANAPAESPGPGSSHAGVSKPSPRRSKKTEDNKLATSVECSVRDAEPDTRTNGTTVTSAVAAQGPKKIYAKRRSKLAGENMLLKKQDVEERDVESSPLAVSSFSTSRLEENHTQRTMDEEDIRVAEEIKNILKEDCLNFSTEPTAPSASEAQKLTRKGSARKEKPLIVPADESKGKIPAGRVSPPKNTQCPKKNPTMQREITEEEKVTDDIEYILNDDIPAAESSGQTTTGRVSPSKKAQHLQKNCTAENNITEDDKLVDDLEYILNDDIPVAKSNGQNTIGRVSPKKKSPRDEKLGDDIDYILNDDIPAAESNGQNTTGRGSPKKKSSRDKKLGEDINYILNDDIAVAESNGQNTTGRGSPKKKSSRDKKLGDDINYILNDDIAVAESKGQNTTGRVSPKKMSSRDEKLGDDIDYILNDDIPAAESNTFTAGRVSPSKKAQHLKKKTLRKNKVTEDEKLEVDIDYILSADIPAAESNVEITVGTFSPKEKAQRANKKSTSENKLIDDKNIAKDVKDDISVVEEVNSQISSPKDSSEKKVPFQEPGYTDDNVINDVEDGSSGKVTSGLGALPPPTKDFVRKHSKQADEQLAKDIEYILHEDDIFAVEPEVVAITSSPSELPRPKTSNPRLSLAMEMDRIFDPASIDCSDQADGTLEEDHEKADFVSNATMVSNSGVAPRPRKKPRRKKSKYMAILEDAGEETDSSASVTTTSSVSPLQNDSSSSAGAEKHQITHSTRSKETTEDEPASKDRMHTLKGHSHNGKLLQPISSSSGLLLRRPKTRNPKRMLANSTQSSSSAASSPRAVSCQRQDSLRKVRQASYKSAKDGLVHSASNVQMALTACAAPCTNSGNNSTKKSKDTLILEDVDSSEQIASGSCKVTRSPTISPWEEKHAKDVIAGKKSDNKVQNTKDVASIGSNASSASAGTRWRKKHPTKQHNKTDEASLDKVINEILEIPAVDLGGSVENPLDARASLKTNTSSTLPNKVKHTEEFKVDEAIEEIIGIPAADSGSLVEHRTDVTASLKKNSKAQLRQSQCTEEIDLDEAIEEILSIPTPGGDSKQAAKLHSVGKVRKTNSRKKVSGESRGMDTKKPTKQTTRVPDIGFPDAKASSSSDEAINCDSGCSVASGDNMRPMAAGPSRVKSRGCSASSETLKLPSSHNTGQQQLKRKQTLPAILIKEENTVRKPRMRASRDTAEPSPGDLQGMITHSKAAVPVTGENSTRTSPGIFYGYEELELMKQIERESRCC